MGHAGGCLCGALRFRLDTAPTRVTYCHCRFCQRVAVAGFASLAFSRLDNVHITAGTPSIFGHVSTGSGAKIQVHFCENCGSAIQNVPMRFPGITGIHLSAFDDANALDLPNIEAAHVYVGSARADTILPAGVPIFKEHGMAHDGSTIEPIILSHATPARDVAL